MHVGIDLGSYDSRIARLGVDGLPRLVPDARDSSSLVTRSLVHVGRGGAVVGRGVTDLLTEQPTLAYVDRVPDRIGDSSLAYLDDRGRSWLPETILAVLLSKLRQDLLADSDEVVKQAVVAIPPSYSAKQRHGLKAAAKLAEFPVVRLVESPVAAAAFYGLQQEADGTRAIVCDVGAHSLTVSVVQFRDGKLELVASDTTSRVCGKSIDQVIENLIAQRFIRHHGGYDPRRDSVAVPMLAKHVENFKSEVLAGSENTTTRALLLGGRIETVTIARSQLQSIVEQIAKAAVSMANQFIAAAGMDTAAIQRAYLIGRPVRIAFVAQLIATALDRSGRIGVSAEHPEAAVAFGAAILGQSGLETSLGATDTAADDQAPATIGLLAPVENGAMTMDVTIQQGTPLPVRATRTLSRSSPQQKDLLIVVVSKGANDDSFNKLAELRCQFPEDADFLVLEMAISSPGRLETSLRANGIQVHQQSIGIVDCLEEADPSQMQLLAGVRLV